MKIILSLNWPPSVNHYWGRNGNRMFISAFGKAYRQEVWAAFKQDYPGTKPITDRLHVRILASPPDNRKRDLDNILKSLLDALMHSGIFTDDEQIDALEIYRTKEKNNGVHVVVKTI